jgi:putative addiction module component (TIGR02574 family)
MKIMQTELDQLRKLSVADKLRIVEQLWDDIGESEEPLLVRGWHKEEAQRRAADLEANPDSALTRDELWKLVDESNG